MSWLMRLLSTQSGAHHQWTNWERQSHHRYKHRSRKWMHMNPQAHKHGKHEHAMTADSLLPDLLLWRENILRSSGPACLTHQCPFTILFKGNKINYFDICLFSHSPTISLYLESRRFPLCLQLESDERLVTANVPVCCHSAACFPQRWEEAAQLHFDFVVII